MDKWKKFGSYEGWVSSNRRELEQDHKEYIRENYNPIEPDTYTSFDDFCMGRWQWLD